MKKRKKIIGNAKKIATNRIKNNDKKMSDVKTFLGIVYWFYILN
jgi:hypothetical protein